MEIDPPGRGRRRPGGRAWPAGPADHDGRIGCGNCEICTLCGAFRA